MKKRGYALMGALMMMVVILALTGLLMTLVTLQSSSGTVQNKRLHNRVQMAQVAQNFADNTAPTFVQIYENAGFEKTQDGQVTRLYSPNFAWLISVQQSGENAELKLIAANGRVDALVEKTGQNVTLWTYAPSGG